MMIDRCFPLAPLEINLYGNCSSTYDFKLTTKIIKTEFLIFLAIKAHRETLKLKRKDDFSWIGVNE